MKKTFFASLLIATALAGSVQAQDIFEALSETYKTNPTLQAQRAYLRSVDENVAIAKSGYRPTVALTADYNNASGNTQNDAVGTDLTNDNTQKTIGAKISQPIFSGFSTVNSVKSADSNVKAQQNNLFTVEQSVFLDASIAYLDVAKNMAIVDLQKNNEKLLKKKLDETQQRFNVGEVTRTDVSQALARYSRAKSDRITSEGTLETSKASYAKIIGVAPENLSEPTKIAQLVPKSLNDANVFALENNYVIKQAKNNFDSQKYNVAAQNGALLPQVSLDGIASKNRGDYDAKDGTDKTDNVEVGVNMTVPLYNAGESRAKIRQSKYQKWQAQEQLLEAERSVQASVSSAWELMVANDALIKSTQEQVKANGVALDGVQKEEALGNRTILDVLDAYQELLNSNVEEVKARREYYVSAMQVLLSMGKLTAQDLKLDVDLYNADKYYQDTKDKWFSLSID